MPVLTVLRYSEVDEAVTLANNTEFGLGGLVFSQNPVTALAVADRMDTGSVGINFFTSNHSAPFGGRHDSGLGDDVDDGHSEDAALQVEHVQELEHEASWQHELMTSMIERQVDGFILLPASNSDPEKIASLVAAATTPTVTVARRIQGLDYVGSDNVAGGELLGNHLASIGCKTVAFVGGLEASSTIERSEGLARALTARELDFWNDEEQRAHITPAGRVQATAALLDRGRLPDAVVAYNDIVALGIYEELHRRELRPGEDIAVASFDYTRFAARLLLRLLDDGENGPLNDLLAPKLKLRSSTVSWRPRGIH